jgi:hypothetical protein
VSDTQRTDKESFFPHDSKYRVCDADFARQLERELNALDASALRLGAASRKLLEMACEQKERIKRLEEAGDYLCAAAAFMGWHDKIETWNKAKEAK